jgi:hypothetical protein
MVTKSFGKRNFMQPTWRPKHAFKVPCFFSFYVLRGGGMGNFFIFPNFPMCSHYVPFKFPMGSQYVPQFHNVFPNMFSIPPHFYPTCLGKWCPPFTYIAESKGRNYIFQNRAFCFGESLHFFQRWANQIDVLSKKIKIKNLGDTSSN